MTPYYPARDGYPSMFEAEGNAGAAVGGKPLHRSLVDRLLANQFQCPSISPSRSIPSRRRSTSVRGRADASAAGLGEQPDRLSLSGCAVSLPFQLVRAADDPVGRN